MTMPYGSQNTSGDAFAPSALLMVGGHHKLGSGLWLATSMTCCSNTARTWAQPDQQQIPGASGLQASMFGSVEGCRCAAGPDMSGVQVRQLEKKEAMLTGTA